MTAVSTSVNRKKHQTCTLTIKLCGRRQEVNGSLAAKQLHCQQCSRVRRLGCGYVGQKHPLPLTVPQSCI